MDWATAGAGLLGDIYSASENREQAQRNRRWQERMSSTAYQRATADMRAAGLSPLLAYSQGGASTPSGSQANIDVDTSKAVSNALQAKTISAQVDKVQAETEGVTHDNKVKALEGEIADLKLKALTAITDADNSSTNQALGLIGMFPALSGLRKFIKPSKSSKLKAEGKSNTDNIKSRSDKTKQTHSENYMKKPTTGVKRGSNKPLTAAFRKRHPKLLEKLENGKYRIIRRNGKYYDTKIKQYIDVL
jgi:predicted RNA-binding protein